MKKSGTLAALLVLSSIGAACVEAASRAVIESPDRTTDTAPTLGALASSGQVKIDSVGTGETSGHVLDLKIRNQTDRPINCAIPPMILESKTRTSQDYVCPARQTVTINPHGIATVPVNGVCINRNKPPVGKGAPGDLIVNTGDSTGPQNPGSHIPVSRAQDLLRICTAKFNAADELQKSGALKNLPYHDPQKQKDIVVQWSTWCDPRISQITGAPQATKDDLKKVVYKQVEEQGPMTPEKKKKVDQGIDTIFEKVELTTATAKDLEKPGAFFEGPASTEKPGPFFEPGETESSTPTPSEQTPPAAQTPIPPETATQTPRPTQTPQQTETQAIMELVDCRRDAESKLNRCIQDAKTNRDSCLDKCRENHPVPGDYEGRQKCNNECAGEYDRSSSRCERIYGWDLDWCIRKYLASRGVKGG
jgi:hypothetical protein